MNKSALFKNYILPSAVLSGSITGVGFFSLPYIALRVGIFPMLFYFFILGFLVLWIHLLFSEVAVLTPDFKRFPGFVRFHLGKWPGLLYLISAISGSIGVMLVYLIIGSQFLANIFGGSQLLYAFLFWGVITCLLFFGIRIICKVEFGVMVFLGFILFFIFISGFSQIKLSNIFISNFKFQISNLLLPYGPIVFSLWGTGAIPEVEELLGKNKKNIKKVILLSFLTVSVIYLFFIFLILGISGGATTETALTGLKNYLGRYAFSLSLSLGVVTTFTASVMAGLTLKKVFMYDLGVKKTQAWIIASFTPLILFLLGLNSFIPLISFIGGVLLSIEGMLILLMYKKIMGNKLFVYPLGAVFLLAIIYEIWF
ncbi:MAG: hypothetical protein HYT36_03600 [Candidatus Staskawiczbacteria bacterium]|nr:hypothetical protein [Candidatus Staskawiczbacteria bacterium]